MLHGLAGSGQSHSTYRRAKVVPNLMSKGDVGDFGGDMRGIVLHSDDASVQRLLLSIRVQFVLLTDAPRASCDKRLKNMKTLSHYLKYRAKVNSKRFFFCQHVGTIYNTSRVHAEQGDGATTAGVTVPQFTDNKVHELVHTREKSLNHKLR